MRCIHGIACEANGNPAADRFFIVQVIDRPRPIMRSASICTVINCPAANCANAFNCSLVAHRSHPALRFGAVRTWIANPGILVICLNLSTRSSRLPPILRQCRGYDVDPDTSVFKSCHCAGDGSLFDEWHDFDEYGFSLSLPHEPGQRLSAAKSVDGREQFGVFRKHRGKLLWTDVSEF
jgi:hypothetical protein